MGIRDLSVNPLDPNTENPFIEDTTTLQPFASGPSGGLTADAVTVTDTGGYYTGTELEAVTQEIGAALALVGPPASASDTVAGIVELATVSETNTGTDATRSVTPDGLAGSVFGTEPVTVEVIPATTALSTGDGKKYFKLPSTVNGMNLVAVSASVFAKSTSGDPTIQLARGRQSSATSAHTYVDMLSTRITIDANDYDSKDASTAAVIDTSNDDVATGDMIRVDVDTAGTAATGLFVVLEFRLP